MTEKSEKSKKRRRVPFLKKGLHITDHNKGDIWSDQPVFLHEGATVLGNVVAPKIRIAGLLHGTAVARELIVENSGQVMGDVIATKLGLKSGGKIQGWVCNLDPQTALPTDDESLLLDVNKQDTSVIISEEVTQTPDSERLDVLHHLQADTGKALIALRELKEEFEKKLNERTGEVFREADNLTQNLVETKLDLEDLQRQFSALKKEDAAKNIQISALSQTLNEVKTLSEQRHQELKDIQDSHKQLIQSYDQLTTEKQDTGLAFENAKHEIEYLSKQYHTIELAHSESKKRKTELEDALLHWQELAEANQIKLANLKNERNRLQRSIDESAGIIGILQEKNGRLAYEWQETFSELERLRKTRAGATADDLQVALEGAYKEIDSQKVVNAKLKERLLWHKANLETIQQTLDQNRLITNRQSAYIEQLQLELADNDKMADFNRGTERDLDPPSATTSTKLPKKEEQDKAIYADLQESLRHKTVQLEEHEAEIEHYRDQLNIQGERLAEVQALLAEQGLEFSEAKGKIEKQSKFINQFKIVTSKRIKELEKQLSQIESP